MISSHGTEERKKLKFFYISGRVESIILLRDDCGLFDSWYVEHVAIEHDTEGKAHFPLSRWLPADTPMKFNKFDSQLPQFVKRADPDLYKQRAAELDRKKKDFAYGTVADIRGMPRTVSRCTQKSF